MKIKFGDIEYYTLHELRDKLMYWGYNKLDLNYLDKLRTELDIAIKAIDLEYKMKIAKEKEANQTNFEKSIQQFEDGETKQVDSFGELRKELEDIGKHCRLCLSTQPCPGMSCSSCDEYVFKTEENEKTNY